MARPDAIRDPRVRSVLDRMDAENIASFEQVNGRAMTADTWSSDPFEFAECPLSISAELGELLYLLTRAARATRAVDFATSVGTSLIYLAAAIRDNGGGIVIGSELVPAKVEIAEKNVAEAGLSEFVEIRTGDALSTLADVGGPVDIAVIDGFQKTDQGWSPEGESSLALEVLQLLTPQLRPGAMLINDNAEPDYLEHVRTPANGFHSTWVPLMPQLSEVDRRKVGALLQALPADSPLRVLMPTLPGAELSVRD
jgi:predicted O-methyltransferase YrrM